MSDVRTIRSNLVDFTAAVKRGESINCTSKGEWYYENWFIRVVRYIFGLENRRLANVAYIFSRFLDEQESHPVKFSAGRRIAALQGNTLQARLHTAQVLEGAMKARNACWRIQTQLNYLKRRVIALQYRYEAVNGGIDKKAYPAEVYPKLMAIAQQWKNTQEILDPHEKAINKTETKYLKEAMRYPEFIKLLYRDKPLQDQFFKWTVRDHNSAGIFVEFPGKHQQIKESLLSWRFGRYHNKMLRIEKNDVTPVVGSSFKEKHLTVAIEGKRVSMLDNKRTVTLSHNYKLTIQEILDMFKDKNHDYGNLEVFADGICNWNVGEMARYNPANKGYERIDLSAKFRNDWWEQLPSMGTISSKEALKRYGAGLSRHPNRWGVRIVSTRELRDKSLKGNHVYVEVAIPNHDDKGTYSMYAFGKSALDLPRHWWQYARIVAETVKGVITYPDSSIFNPRRQHKGRAFSIPAAEGKQVMDWIRKSIQRGWTGNMAYQLLTENCAKWAEEIRGVVGSKKVPRNLFLVPFSASEPEGCCGRIFSIVRRLPYCFQDCFFTAFFWPLGSTTKMTVIEDNKPRTISLARLKPWRPQNEFRIPAVQIERLENGDLNPIATL